MPPPGADGSRRPPDRRRELGAYYTPGCLARPLARLALARVRRRVPRGRPRLRVLDPACGAGHLLRAVARLAPDAHLMGMDCDAAALEQARRALPDADLRQQDSLREPPARGFDLVIANPPFRTEARRGAHLFRELRRTSDLVARHYRRNCDLADLFVAQATEALAPGGVLAFVVPDALRFRSGSAHTRELLDTDLTLLEWVDLGVSGLFPGAPGAHPALLLARLGTGPPPEPVARRLPLAVIREGPDAVERWLDSPPSPATERLRRVADRLVLVPPDLEELVETAFRPGAGVHLTEVHEGLQTYPGRLQGQGVFVLERPEVEALRLQPAERALLRPFFRPRDIQPYRIVASRDLWVIYADRETARRIATDRQRFGRLAAHLDRFAGRMTSAHRPYGLHRPRQREIFERSDKVVTPRKTRRAAFAAAPGPFYADEGVKLLVPPRPWTPHALTAVLNTPSVEALLRLLKRQGEHLQVDRDCLVSLPLPPLTGTAETSAGVPAAVERARAGRETPPELARPVLEALGASLAGPSPHPADAAACDRIVRSLYRRGP